MANVFGIHSVGDSIATLLRNSYPAELRQTYPAEFRLVSTNELAEPETSSTTS